MKTKKIVSLILAMVMALSLSSVFVMATDACYVNNAISQTITGTPAMDGSVSADEYGDPIIVTSQAHANANNDKLTWTKQSSPENAEQRAKIYMTYDQTYLYIAATLDHAQENLRTDGVGGGYQPHLAVTASQKVGNGVFVSNGKEVYLFSRLAYKGKAPSATQDYFSRKYTATTYYDLSGSQGSDYYVEYDENTSTYTYEMRIQWGNIPGMGSTYNGSAVAMTVELADGGAGESRNPSYYQIGGTAAQQGNFNSQNPHGENVLTIVPVGQFRVSNSVAPMPNVAPTVNGKVDEGEYGAPVIITNQKPATAVTEDQIFWTQNKTPDNKDQQVKVYITNDDTYLYIAATLDHATVNTRESGGGGYHPHLAVTLSQNVDNGVFKNAAGNEIYYLYRTAYKGTSAGLVQDFYSARFTADQSAEGSKNKEQYTVTGTNDITADPETNTKSFFVSYANDTYTFEMRIKLADAPGLKDENGNYNGADIAMTLEVADAGTNGGDGGYYTIGGNASHQGNFNTVKNPHGENVMTFTCNPPVVAEKTLQEKLDECEAGKTLTLEKDETVDELNVPNGVTLDLAGYTLTSNYVVSKGDIKDSGNGTGAIVMPQNDENDDTHILQLAQTNSMIALYDTNCYRFYKYTFEYETRETSSKNAAKYGIRVGLPSAEAYALLNQKANRDTLTINLALDNNTKFNYAFKAETIEEYVTKSSANPDKTYGIMLTVSGLDKVEEAELTLTVSACLSFANIKMEKAYSEGE